MCDCRETFNGALAPYNAQLATAFRCPPGGAMRLEPYLIQIEKLDSGKRARKPPLVLASFCPFCGEKLNPEVETLQHENDKIIID